MKRLALAAPLALLLAIPALAQDTGTVRPGHWEYAYKIAGLNVSTEYKCLKREEIDKFFSGPSNRHYKCTYPTKVVGNGKALFDGTCKDKRGRTVPMHAEGTYSDTDFTLKLKLKTIHGLPLSGTMKAKWIAAACPA